LVCLAIKTLTGDQSLKDIGGAYQKYNEDQFTTVKLPGSSKLARIDLTEGVF
jgi:hypothetical protein